MKTLYKIILSITTLLFTLPSGAQGVKIYVNDGSVQKVFATELDSITSQSTTHGLTDEKHINGYEFVDMGLSVNWATQNVGATTPEDYGNYYSWGEIETKESYEESNTKLLNGLHRIIKSISGSVDYDVATAKWGEPWRMPTLTECQELLDNCTFIEVKQNEVIGILVTSKITDNSIFLPYSGLYASGEVPIGFGAIDRAGYYWTEKREYTTHPYSMIFSKDPTIGTSQFTSSGLSIRPVTSANVTPRYLKWNDSLIDNTLYLDYQAQDTIVLVNANVKDIVCELSNSEGFNAYYDSEQKGVIISTTKNTTEAERSCVVSLTSQAADTTITCTVIQQATSIVIPDPDPDPDPSEVTMVDLGLSVKWASHNIGATTPDDYGDYLSWGEMNPKDSYTDETYQYYPQYLEDDISATSYDVAKERWGDLWRMPTVKEFRELVYYCTWEWIQYNETGNYGIKVTGPNGNSIFFPAGGYPNWSGWNRVGSYGTYWTGSTQTSGTSYYFCFSETQAMGVTSSDGATYVGQLVRPVYGEMPDDSKLTMVDLGLSVKWASHNMGAATPGDFGDYYAWGEVETKEVYSDESYLYTSNPIREDIAGTDMDVAHVKWGDQWRMPTQAEIQELIDKCSYESKYHKTTGVYGAEFTGPNGQTIFLPIGGYKRDSEHLDLEYCGYYWSGSVDLSKDFDSFSLNRNWMGWFNIDTMRMSWGLPIRPVYGPVPTQE